ncbi:MAG TPA: hypothetical protein VM510_05625, partial [Caulifigura sp.]|nr:hypothetical protein [Caulifigura sp.]
EGSRYDEISVPFLRKKRFSMKMSAFFLLLALAFTAASGCGGSAPAGTESGPPTAEQLATAAKEEADVQDAERAQQQQVQRKPTGKR